jgi:hypothetical protein
VEIEMANERLLRGFLHRTTHHIPGVPAHAEQPAGHQGTALHGAARHPGSGAPHPSQNRGWNHSPARTPRLLPAWQRRIAALFGREL